MQKTFAKSNFGRSATYTCRACGKLTRETGHGESSGDMCAFCWLESELENSVSDGVITEEEFEESLAELRRKYKREG